MEGTNSFTHLDRLSTIPEDTDRSEDITRAETPQRRNFSDLFRAALRAITPSPNRETPDRISTPPLTTPTPGAEVESHPIGRITFVERAPDGKWRDMLPGSVVEINDKRFVLPGPPSPESGGAGTGL
jgi:hypothetical protein